MQEQEVAQIHVEIISEEPEQVDSLDVALVGEVRTAVFRQLEEDGFSPSLEQTQQKGGDVLFLVGVELAHLAQMAWDHHHEIVEAIDDLGTLYLLVEKAIQIARRINQAWHKKTQAIEPVEKTCRITLQVDGVDVTLQTADLEGSDAALRLAQRFARLAPEVAKQASGRSRVHLQGKIPRQQRRKRKGRR
jgi:hypothetical protein